ncbi:hypothetical protein [Pedobacter nyackensis]|uniref:hypothetical protein n=1 Tax=Pedobacter nyackensis TaxID=475255 RepID=UPI00292CDF29|nr:hypothetical protein [Pedobacter nyackensis]
MGNKIKMHLILCVGVFMFFACKKGEVIKEKEKPTVAEPIKPNPPKDTTITTPPKPTLIFEVGTGSGNLSIDANTLKIPTNSVIKIKSGSYSSIRVSNFLYETGIVQIQNDGLVELVGEKQLTFSNIKNVVFTGSGTKGLDKGFVFRDKNSDATSVQLLNNIDNFTFKDVKFTNVKTYNAIQYDSKKVYNGSESSYSKNIKFSNIECDNTGTLIRFRGSAENGAIVGLIKDIEISYITFKNSPNVGSVVAIENVQGYNIHNNIVQNVNQSNDNHNGIFYMQGNGKFYNNNIKDHQGNALRAWVYSIGTTPQTTLIFNNIVANSRQYGAFELQAFTRNMMSGSTTYSNAMVFNNTCGNLLPKGGFPAQVLDLYSLLGGSCEIFNNFGYNFTLVGQNNTNFIWNELNDTKPTGYSNKYTATYKAAGILDDTRFSLGSGSILKNSGSTLNGRNLETLTNQAYSKDIYGNQRSLSNPSIGAVE